ncbi:helix-turn-helix transcriptional regulator [Campylobacter fetus subsp. venerealis]|uniref:helix-turn-helix domain-containing protein n=1 Tax=Campylobacter fetus TaxID=196 RepID=UPI0018E8DCE1|nr:AraC family transcriptional regulator [Campylobacter fetus]QQF52050.1 helix-turn-helix transcriptional regulator [Campylobacter fetus subsp. venerealis]
MIIPNNILHKYKFIGDDELMFLIYGSEITNLKYQAKFEKNAIIFVKNGKKIVYTSKKEYGINSGDILFLPSKSYTLSDIKAKNEYKSLILFFSDELLIKLLKKYKVCFQKEIKTDNFICYINKDEILKNIFCSLELYSKNGVFDKNIINLKFEELFLYMLTSKNEIFNSYLSSLVKLNSIDFKAMFLDDIAFKTVFDMANAAKMDISSFSRKFKTLFKISPKEWIDNKRFDLALYLIKNSDKNINQICSECGFSSPAWFIARFKNKFDLTPNELKKSNNLYNLP